MSKSTRGDKRSVLLIRIVGLALVVALVISDLGLRSFAQGNQKELESKAQALIGAVFKPIAVSDSTSTKIGEVLFNDTNVTFRRISVKPHSDGTHYSHPGGYVMLLTDFEFEVAIPLGAELRTQLKAGEILPIPAGNYELNNATDQPLEIVSIEVKDTSH